MNHKFTSQKKQQGIALIVSLIILVLMTLLAMSMMRGNSLFERIAGNTREKQRALQSAQDALLHAEWWVQQAASVTTPVACTAANQTTMQVCQTDATTSVATVNALPFYTGWHPDNMTVMTGTVAGGTVSSAAAASSGGEANDVIYASNPGIYINTLPAIGPDPLYRITAIGYGGTGGTNGTVAIVQSIFMVAGTSSQLPPGTCLSC